MDVMMDTELPGSDCPYCSKRLDAATSTEGDHRPKPGDTSFCLYCAHPLVFDESLRLRKPTAEEMREFAADRHFQVVWDAVLKDVVARERG
jgi:hypothetical protein